MKDYMNTNINKNYICQLMAVQLDSQQLFVVFIILICVDVTL